MKKQLFTRIWILLTVFFMIGCSKATNTNYTDASETNEQRNASQMESEQLSPWKVMDRIIEDYGLNNAQDYNDKVEDMSKDAIVMLCQSESGKYTAYGFISLEYGQTGILIDNMINGESNWNYFDEATWIYSDSKPTLSEQGEYNVIFTYTQGNGLEKTVYFDTFDTGTMSIKESTQNTESGTDLQTAAKAWADAFCTRDGDALWEMFDPERRDDFYVMGFVQSGPEDDYIAIGWSSPWPMDYLYTMETEGEKTLFTYYPMTSNPHRWVWKQSVSWKQKDGRWYGYQDSFVTYDTIVSAGDFADAYSGGISGTPMDYCTDCEGWEDALEKLAEEEAYKVLLTVSDKAAEYLLNLAHGTGTIKWMEDRTTVVAYQFEYGDQILITMRQPEGKTIWLPENWEENKEETPAVTVEGNLVAALAGKWRLAAEKTEKNLKEYDSLQSMWGTGIHYGNEMEIGPDGSFRFYIAINYGGEGTVKEGDGRLLADTEPYAPEGSGGSPTQFEIIPVTEDGIQYLTMSCMDETLYWERQLEEKTLPEAYGKALWDIYRQGVLPDGHQLEYTGVEMAEKNKFAICDVDGDGREELLICWSDTVSMAGKAEYVLDSGGGQCYTELSEYPGICYYDNGSAQADWSHNQGKGGRIWPKNFYRYNAEMDVYERFGSMEGWDKSLEAEGFPDEIDADGDGLVYYLMSDDWKDDYENGEAVDGPAYEAWRAECMGEARLIQPAYQQFTAENIEALGFVESEWK